MLSSRGFPTIIAHLKAAEISPLEKKIEVLAGGPGGHYTPLHPTEVSVLPRFPQQTYPPSPTSEN